MRVHGKHYRTIWPKEGDHRVVQIIDQRHLPHQFIVEDLITVEEYITAIKDMHVRGAGLIGATAGFAMHAAALAAPHDDFDTSLKDSAARLTTARPTATNLAWAVSRQLDAMMNEGDVGSKRKKAFATACAIADEDADFCRRIGLHGVTLIEKISGRKKEGAVNILTHCNAGWLAFVDHGSATAPIYEAHRRGIKVHVWVDETRPWNQGAKLTAWELGQEGVPHTLITDNAGGLLMQRGLVDLVIVGSDRTTVTGDVANKIGTYLKALAARDNNVPFYAALPSSTFDWKMKDGLLEIPIEERSGEEVKYVSGLTKDGAIERVLISPPDTAALNYGFDVTPSRLVAGLITERGVVMPREEDILALFPEHGA